MVTESQGTLSCGVGVGVKPLSCLWHAKCIYPEECLLHPYISCKFWYLGTLLYGCDYCLSSVLAKYSFVAITSLYFLWLLSLHIDWSLLIFDLNWLCSLASITSCNYILFTAVKPSVSSCFHCIWCLEWCCSKEIWSRSMVSGFSNLQRVGILFKLYRLSGQKIRNSIWTEKGQYNAQFHHINGFNSITTQ